MQNVLQVFETATNRSTFLTVRDVQHPVPPNLVCHFSFLAINPLYRGRNLSIRLIEMGKQIIRNRGYKYGHVECTSAFSTAALIKAGFVIDVFVDYSTVEGRREGIDMGPHIGVNQLYIEL